MLITYHIRFFLHKRSAADTDSLVIRLRVTLKGCRPLDFPTGISTSLRQWDAGHQRIMRSAVDAGAKNLALDEIYGRVEEVFARYELIEKRTPTLPELKEHINIALGRADAGTLRRNSDNLFDAFDTFVSERSVNNQWKQTTVNRFMVLRRKIYRFNPHLTFDDLTEHTMLGFVEYLGTYHLNNVTLAKTLSNFRWFIRWAAARGLYKGNVHETFRPKMKGSDGSLKEVIYLTLDEIHTLQQHQFPEGQHYMERVRDVLLFCCFTGLRYSDVRHLRRSDITDGCISIVTQKTSDPLRIELNRHSEAILRKYRDYPTDHDAALPVISNEKMNVYIKQLGRDCGIDTPVRTVYFEGSTRHEEVYPKYALLSTHVGRRTFVVTGLQLGIPAEVIMKWTGHKDYKAMRPYIKIVDDLKKRNMSLFDDI